jgi:hypothetical protein
MADTRAGLEEAHGQVRDSLAAIKGFVTLLGSRRVSPRNLASSLPDVEGSCGRLMTSAQQAVPLLEEGLGTGATGTLLGTLLAGCQTLHAALQAAKPINAARRIELERIAQAVLPDLDASLVSFELLKEALLGDATMINVTSLLSQGISSDAILRDGERSVRATMVVSLEQPEIKVKPKVAALVLASSVSYVSQGGQGLCCVEVSSTVNPGFLIRVTREQRPGIEIQVAIPHLTEASEQCCKTAARSCGAELAWWDNPKRALVSWPLH